MTLVKIYLGQGLVVPFLDYLNTREVNHTSKIRDNMSPMTDTHNLYCIYEVHWSDSDKIILYLSHSGGPFQYAPVCLSEECQPLMPPYLSTCDIYDHTIHSVHLLCIYLY